MPNSIITNSIMGRKIDFSEFFCNGTGCYCLFREDKFYAFHANLDVNDALVFWF